MGAGNQYGGARRMETDLPLDFLTMLSTQADEIERYADELSAAIAQD